MSTGSTDKPMAMKFNDNKAIYLQLADRICDEILLGNCKEEDRIPSVREYATEVEVNAGTVVKAYDWLCLQDIIFTKRGLGFFVSKGARQAIRKMRRQEFMINMLPQIAHAMHTLDISMDELVEKLQALELKSQL